MSFVSAGVHSAGITAYNEAGIFLASHVVPSDEAFDQLIVARQCFAHRLRVAQPGTGAALHVGE